MTPADRPIGSVTEAEAEAEGNDEAPAPQARRGLRLGTVALGMGAVLGVVGLAFSPLNTIYPLNLDDTVANVRRAAEASGLVAPAANLATAPRPEPVPSADREPTPRVPRDQQLGELLSLRPGVAPPPAPSAAPSAPPASPAATPSRPVDASPSAPSAANPGSAPSISLPPPAQVPMAPLATAPAMVPATPPTPPPALIVPSRGGEVTNAPSASPPTQRADSAGTAPEPMPSPSSPTTRREEVPTETTARPAPPAPPPPIPFVVPPSAPQLAAAGVRQGPSDPATVAARLRPAPMSPPEEVQLLEMLSQIGVIVRDLRESNVRLRQDQANTRERLEAELTDFRRRLALAEAGSAVRAALAAGAPTEGATPAQPPLPAAGRVAPAPAPAPAGRPEASGPRRYQVRAASPGLAMISEIGRSGDPTAQMQIAVGDDIPGLGRVQAIEQRGSNWVVRAERGVIQ